MPDTLRPPELCALLQADLADLATGPDGPSPTASQAVEREQIIAFTLPEGADPRGAAWAIGGSAMGGRMMLHSLRGSGRDDLPSRFLASEDALAFWHALKPRLEIECTAGELRSAVAAARAVFLHFLHAASRTVPEPAE
ncbi:MAG: hypothetical protein IE921_00265 [Rhodobacteraceae bacterium]|nr:hypothetical protein [Paracoccaceae bacterium]